MLRISKLADYGTIVMVYLAKNTSKFCNARDISFNTHLTVPTVSKLLKKLNAKGLLVSVRGVNGGYQLQRNPLNISLADIIYALDDTRGLTECSHTPNECMLQSFCNVKSNWRLISQAIDSALTSVSLEELTSPALKIKFGVISE
jgi:FeS assembly SUF system regulator